MRGIIIIITLTISASAESQNLVPDPGFEIMTKTPSREDNSIRCTSNWINPVVSAGDYYNRASDSKFTGVPRNEFGFQEPHSGNGYAGICIQNDLIEYVETKLTSRLIKGKQYLIEFYICKSENRLGSVNEFGVLFTDKMEFGYEKTGIPFKPIVNFVNPNGYTDNKEWTKLTAAYTAEGFEFAFILGYFNYDQTKVNKWKAHYYIDDVSITLINDEKSIISILPAKDSIKEFQPIIGETITLKNIFFSPNKSDLLPESFEELNKLADKLLKNINTSIEIYGHTDNVGKEEENKKLSEARAKAVAGYLTSKEISQDRITCRGFGSTKPIASNETEDGKQQNRRVEFIINNKK